MVAVESEPRTVDVSPPAVAGPVPAQRLPWLVLGLALVAFGYGVTTIRSAAVTEFGLLASASPAYPLSILLAALGFAMAVRRNNITAAVCATILLIVIQRLPATVCTDVPMYSWTYKHLGVTDYIQHKHVLAHGVDIYHGWPGLFALTAWFSDLTGVSATSIAHWFTICFDLAFGGLAYALARAWGLKPLSAVTVMFFAVNLNWISQDYFSPQATAMFFTAAVFILVGLSRTHPVGTPLIILLFTADTITHQLTPFWVLIAIGLLVAGRQLKPRWIVIPLALILLGFFAYNFDEARKFTLLEFNFFSNIRPNIHAVGSLGQRIASFGDRVLTIGVWIATAATLVVRWRNKQPVWALGVLALSPMVIVFGQNYGGEAIFRVFLYSLLGCSIVLAPVVVNTLQKGSGRYLIGAAAILVAVTCSAQGYFGAWFCYVMSKEKVDASALWLERAHYYSWWTPAAIVWPQRSTWLYVDYVRRSEHYDDPIIYIPELTGSHFRTGDEYAKFRDVWLARREMNAPTYLVFTEQMRFYSYYFGIMPADAFPNLQARVAKDPAWKLVYDEHGITIYEYIVENPTSRPETEPPHLGNMAGSQYHPEVLVPPAPTDTAGTGR